MIAAPGLTIGFGKSDKLAALYGVAVSATMLMTSVLLFIAISEIWNWPRDRDLSGSLLRLERGRRRSFPAPI